MIGTVAPYCVPHVSPSPHQAGHGEAARGSRTTKPAMLRIFSIFFFTGKGHWKRTIDQTLDKKAP